MKADDPRLTKAHKQMAERVKRYDERVVTVLKASLNTEQALNDLLKAGSMRWKRRTFAGKIDKAEKLFCTELDAGFWKTIKAANQLRNAVAHGHKEGTITQQTAELKKALLEWVSPEQRPDIEEMTEPQMISTAFNNCASYLVVASDEYGK